MSQRLPRPSLSPRRQAPQPAQRAPPGARRPRRAPLRAEAGFPVALLSGVLQRAPRKSAPAEEPRMSVIEHLEALRRVLIVSFIAWGVATFAAFFVSRPAFGFLSSQAGINHLLSPRPPGAVLFHVKLSLSTA